MNISDDIEVYKLSKLLQIFSDDRNSNFLYEYWVKSNKLKYVPKALGRTSATVAPDEVQYVIALESLFESYMETLNGFIREPYCSTFELVSPMDTSTIQQCDELIIEFENLKSISFNAGWVDLYKDLSVAFAKITAKINRLLASHSTEKQFHFVTNVEAEDFISCEDINFKRKIGRYFVIDKQAN